MEFSIATLLANFTDDKLVAPKVLEKKLGCQDDPGVRQLQIALDALEKIGILVKDKGRYRRVWEDGVVEAKLRCSSKGFCFAIQDAEGAEDIYIRECHLSNAWNGDRVLVTIIKEGSRRRSPEGEVRLILERANPSVLARVKQTALPTGRSVYKAVPLDDRLLFEVDIAPNGLNLNDAIDHLVHVEVLRYPLGPYPPLGRVAQILGSDAEAANDLDIVCCKHDLPRAFPAAVLEALKSVPKQPRKPDLKTRMDLRDLLTIANSAVVKTEEETPQYPVEHAFTLEATKAGNWRVGVHISDVAYYVLPDTALDREARKRGTAAYLGELVLPLLPEPLSLGICSLSPGEDKLTVSVLLTLDAQGKLLEFQIQPTIIRVDSQLTAEQVQYLLHKSENVRRDVEGITPWWTDVQGSGYDPERTTDLPAPVVKMVEQLFKLGQALKTQRQERGAFELNLPQNQYGSTPSPYNDEGALGAISSSAHLSFYGTLCELIILANQAIATHLQGLGVPGIYRVQSTPDVEEVLELVKLAGNLGVELEPEDEETIRPADFKAFTEEFARSNSERVLTYLLQATLKPAAYSTTAGPHFGLALENGYTHATSPLQRYADLLVQRMLTAVFELGRDRKSIRSKERVNLRHSSCHGEITWNVLPPEEEREFEAQFTTVVGHLTDREKLTQEAEADLAGLKKAGLMKERTGETFSGLITGVQSYGFFVEIEVAAPDGIPQRLEGLVHVSSLKDDWYEYRSRQQTLVGRKNRKQYRLGDRVEVQVKSVDYYRQQIDLVAVGGGSEATSYDDEPPVERSYRRIDRDAYDPDEED